ncbi:hypothetical protein LAD12857_05480 [Lacrimispora amygdalina]|uniref:Uncharacterized protein n=1 Tax=Lacrimispora amygdalina TaxID=253257 RepID=A0ABQ5M270_9FIRM
MPPSYVFRTFNNQIHQLYSMWRIRHIPWNKFNKWDSPTIWGEGIFPPHDIGKQFTYDSAIMRSLTISQFCEIVGFTQFCD